MHSLDTVKTRQQGDPHIPPKYTSMSSSYTTILRQEGIRRGLYGGWVPAMLGSFPGTVIFFGTYEYSKRHMIDAGITPQFAYLTSGMYLGRLNLNDLLTDQQAFLLTLLLRLFMSPPKSLKHDYNYKDNTITLFSNLGITTNQQATRPEPLFEKKASRLYFTDTRRLSSVICLSLRCNSHFMSKVRHGPDDGSEVEILGCRWSF